MPLSYYSILPYWACFIWEVIGTTTFVVLSSSPSAPYALQDVDQMESHLGVVVSVDLLKMLLDSCFLLDGVGMRLATNTEGVVSGILTLPVFLSADSQVFIIIVVAMMFVRNT